MVAVVDGNITVHITTLSKECSHFFIIYLRTQLYMYRSLILISLLYMFVSDIHRRTFYCNDFSPPLSLSITLLTCKISEYFNKYKIEIRYMYYKYLHYVRTLTRNVNILKRV